MIESLEIENFRCFKKLSVSKLGRVNVVVGESASGKTALLEAVSLGMGGSPDLSMRFRMWRGLAAPAAIGATRSAYDALWRDAFYQLDPNNSIRILLRGDPDTTRIFEMGYRPETPTLVPVPTANGPTGPSNPLESSVITPITLEWTDDKGKKYKFEPQFVPPSGFVLGGLGFPSLCAFYSSAFMAIVGPKEAADQYSEFSKKKKAGPVGKALRTVFPSIRDLSVENDAGVNTLYCSVPWLAEKSPVALVSSGFNKVLLILLGIAAMAKGVILLDEMENGIYYKTYSGVWTAFLHFCQKFQVQMFVSTHSMECLRATLPALRRSEGEFRLLRVERKKDRRIVRVFDGKDFEAAMEAEGEVR